MLIWRKSAYLRKWRISHLVLIMRLELIISVHIMREHSISSANIQYVFPITREIAWLSIWCAAWWTRACSPFARKNLWKSRRKKYVVSGPTEIGLYSKRENHGIKNKESSIGSFLLFCILNKDTFNINENLSWLLRHKDLLPEA